MQNESVVLADEDDGDAEEHEAMLAHGVCCQQGAGGRDQGAEDEAGFAADAAHEQGAGDTYQGHADDTKRSWQRGKAGRRRQIGADDATE